MLCLAEIIVDSFGNGLELADLLVLSDEALDHANAMDVFLHHGIQPVIGLEHPVKNLEDQGHNAQQHGGQNGNGNEIHGTELGADAHGGDHGEDQHHGAPNGHTDHHLEGHLDVGHIRGQPGDNGGRGEFVNIGEAEILHPVVHIVAQIPGKARSSLGGIVGGHNAKHQRHNGADEQLQRLLPHHSHIAHGNAVVIQVCHNQGDGHFHGYLADHADGAYQCRPFILAQALGETIYHFRDSSFFTFSMSKSGDTLCSARNRYSRNCASSSGVKPSRSFLSPLWMTAYMVSLHCCPLGRM